VVANDPEQWSGRIDIETDVFAVYGEGDHCSLLFTQSASGGCEAIDFPFAKFCPVLLRVILAPSSL
jgi:hypothetical protein